MGCASSKTANNELADYPALGGSSAPATGAGNENVSLNYVYSLKNLSEAFDFGSKEGGRSEDHRNGESHEGKKVRRGSGTNKNGGFSIKFGLSLRHVDAEQIAAGWPAWLSAAAGEAVYGMVPMCAEQFEKLEKIGQGTYSSVFRAREVATGKMVALKKVRFDSFQPESIRFMAREIIILRRLDHPNIIKLEGVITSRMSSSIYLVFEYMEHDLAGLSSSPDINLNESQIKCYMKQLLDGVEHCHLRGVMHRDIKPSNILVNNEGILKLADFGLANILTPKNKHKLTSRVVTLWYRPPELLLGSTNYNVSVDLWSVGCVFAELLIGRTILKGKTEVEQLHKIFKLCGSPPEEYWKKSKIPNVDMFKPQHTYESCLRERCKDFPRAAVNLIETCLSIEPYKRGTASSAIMSEYFTTQPCACDPSSLPRYPPRKEMDAKQRDEARRKKARNRMREPVLSKRPRRARPTLQEPSNLRKLGIRKEMEEETHSRTRYNNSSSNKNDINVYKGRGSALRRKPPTLDTISEGSSASSLSQNSYVSNGESVFTAPTQISASSGFAWAKMNKEKVTTTTSSRSWVRASNASSKPGSANDMSSLTKDETAIHINSKEQKLLEASMHPMQRSFDRVDSSASDVHQSQDYSMATTENEGVSLKKDQSLRNQANVEFSGSLLSESQKVDELLQRNECSILEENRRSRFYRER